ncbi:molybdate ABC transporter substrate-binding protein [Capillimicrobium parvum]|uniref:Molybdate-binding protein ModA n=1 Tax=Capillimicrobium parvum TaxID=2884022 RepID=A0A9E6XS58_9ACTN|nr:molybdate ABC transporter substrate-binding protein [Capillimicrobium parvum]UGS33804.1 Molybdate-binding protein ModA [Capillimicrobium parvum]
MVGSRALATLLAAVALAAAGCGSDSQGGDRGGPGASATVYAASSLRDVLPEIDPAARFSFGGSDTLQLQIERGAPADAFASAAPTQAEALFAEGRCERPVAFATNRLVLIVPREGRGAVTSLGDLGRGGHRLAVGAAGVPVGDYTRRLLAALGRDDVLRDNAVSQEKDVAGIVAKVALGSADAGFVYRTDGLASRGRTRTIALPEGAQPPVRYLACAVRRDGARSAAAQAFLVRLRSDAGRAALRRAGFVLPGARDQRRAAPRRAAR